MLALSLILAALVGDHMHRLFWRPLRADLGPHTGALAGHAIGALTVLPFVALVYRALGGRDWEKLSAAYLAAYLVYGAGNGLSHWRTFRNDG